MGDNGIKALQEQLSGLVASDTDAVFKEMEPALRRGSEAHIQLNVIRGTWNDLSDSTRMNLIDFAKLQVARANIRHSLLSLIFDLGNEDLSKTDRETVTPLPDKYAHLENLLSHKTEEYEALKSKAIDLQIQSGERLIAFGQAIIPHEIRMQAKSEMTMEILMGVEGIEAYNAEIDLIGVKSMWKEVEQMGVLIEQQMPEILSMVREWIEKYVEAFTMGKAFLLVNEAELKLFRDTLSNFRNQMAASVSSIARQESNFEEMQKFGKEIGVYAGKMKQVYSSIIDYYSQLARSGEAVAKILPEQPPLTAAEN